MRYSTRTRSRCFSQCWTSAGGGVCATPQLASGCLVSKSSLHACCNDRCSIVCASLYFSWPYFDQETRCLQRANCFCQTSAVFLFFCCRHACGTEKSIRFQGIVILSFPRSPCSRVANAFGLPARRNNRAGRSSVRWWAGTSSINSAP